MTVYEPVCLATLCVDSLRRAAKSMTTTAQRPAFASSSQQAGAPPSFQVRRHGRSLRLLADLGAAGGMLHGGVHERAVQLQPTSEQVRVPPVPEGLHSVLALLQIALLPKKAQNETL